MHSLALERSARPRHERVDDRALVGGGEIRGARGGTVAEVADRAGLAASYQRAIVDALVARTRSALEREGLRRLAIGGGVAANSELRSAVRGLGVPVWVPPVELCTDNAAMIAGAARFTEQLDYPDYLALDATARAVAA